MPQSYVRCVTTIHWNGKDLPDELRSLPAGLYQIEALEPVGTEAFAVDETEEWEVAAALEALETTADIAHETVRPPSPAVAGAAPVH